MKKTFLLSAAMLAGCMSINAQDINLPKPQPNAKMTVSEALATRHSVRSFTSQELTEQELSNLCWAACGISRDADHRTSPTARNKREIRLFVFTTKAVFEYIAESNKLSKVTDGDHRKLIAGGKGFKQDFVMEAPVSLVMVIDFDKFGSNNETALMMGCVDAGNVSENINIYCQAAGLATVPRATMDHEAIKQLLKLNDNQKPIMNNPVGYAK